MTTDLPWYGWARTERVEIEVGTVGTRQVFSEASERAAWLRYAQLRGDGTPATIRRRRVIECAEPWTDMTEVSL